MNMGRLATEAGADPDQVAFIVGVVEEKVCRPQWMISAGLSCHAPPFLEHLVDSLQFESFSSRFAFAKDCGISGPWRSRLYGYWPPTGPACCGWLHRPLAGPCSHWGWRGTACIVRIELLPCFKHASTTSKINNNNQNWNNLYNNLYKHDNNMTKFINEQYNNEWSFAFINDINHLHMN